MQKHEVKLSDIKDGEIHINPKCFGYVQNIYSYEGMGAIETCDYYAVRLTNVSGPFAEWLETGGEQMIQSCCGVHLCSIDKPPFKLTDVEEKIYEENLRNDLKQLDAGIKYLFVAGDEPKETIQRLEDLGFQKHRTLEGGTIEYRHKDFLGSEDGYDEDYDDPEDSDY